MCVGQSLRCIDDDNRQITLVHHLHGFPDALSAERTDVIQTRGVNHHDGAERQQFHGFGDRIRRCACDVGDNGEVLSGHRVDETGFSGVALAENADMYALRIGRCVHAHTITSNSESFPICGKWGVDVFEHSIPHEYHFVKCTEGVYRCSLREPRRLLESAPVRRGRYLG